MTRFFIVVLAFTLISCDTQEVKRDRFFIRGNDALTQKEWGEAIRFFDNAIKLDNSFALAFNNRGVAKLRDNRPAEAIQDYNEAVAIKPDYYEAIGNRAYAYELINRYRSSIRDWELLIGKFPDSAFLHTSLGLVQAKAMNFQGAIVSFEKSLEIEKNSDEVLVDLAVAYFHVKNHDRAISLLNLAKDINPANAFAYNTFSQILVDNEEYETALVQVDSALIFEPSNPYFLNNKGFIMMELGALEEGLSLINESILLDGKNMWALRNKGIYYLKSESPNQALKYFEQVMKSGSSVDDIYAYAGLAWEVLGDQVKACEFWREGGQRGEIRSKKLLQKGCS